MVALAKPFAIARTRVEAGTRLLSLDALRGFDMIWILGGDQVMQALGKVTQVAALPPQFQHKAWEGVAFFDLIFPLFIFIVGVSLVFSLSRMLRERTRADTIKRILLRAGVLFILGVLYNGGLSHAWPDVRLMGVLQRIGIVYAAAGLLFCFFRVRGLVAVCAALLVGYWALLTYVPIRDVPLDTHALEQKLGREPGAAEVERIYHSTSAEVTGRYDPGLNLTSHVDFEFLPGDLWLTYSDPEGLLSTLPAIATCLLGVLAGLWLRRPDTSGRRKAAGLAAAGVIALEVGLIWALHFPLIKNIWTSSYVLVAGGWSLLMLSVFYYLIEVRRWRRGWSMLVWVGMNPILLYLIVGLLDFKDIAGRFVGGSISQWADGVMGPGGSALLLSSVALGLVLLIARFLHQHKIFLRV